MPRSAAGMLANYLPPHTPHSFPVKEWGQQAVTPAASGLMLGWVLGAGRRAGPPQTPSSAGWRVVILVGWGGVFLECLSIHSACIRSLLEGQALDIGAHKGFPAITPIARAGGFGLPQLETSRETLMLFLLIEGSLCSLKEAWSYLTPKEPWKCHADVSFYSSELRYLENRLTKSSNSASRTQITSLSCKSVRAI